MKPSVFKCLVLPLLIGAWAPLSANTDTDAVQRELTVQMQSLAQTIKEHDLRAQFAFHAPDFSHTLLFGDTLNKEQSENYTRKTDTGPVARQLTFRLNQLVFADNKAYFYCHAKAVSPWRDPNHREKVDAKPRTLVSEADYCYVWVKTPQGWRIKQLQELSVSKMTLDGKPYLRSYTDSLERNRAKTVGTSNARW